MKKILAYACLVSVVTISISDISNAQTVNGCLPGARFNIYTGQPCATNSSGTLIPTSQSSSCLDLPTNLSRGMRHVNMTKLQSFLKAQGDLSQSVILSTMFGPATQAAVKKFQLRMKVVASALTPGYGNVGPKTRAKIKELSCVNQISTSVQLPISSTGGSSYAPSGGSTSSQPSQEDEESGIPIQPPASLPINPPSTPTSPSTPPSTPADSMTKTITQFGITWTFDKEYVYGQFANGDYWVKGPVTIASVSPEPTTDRNGSVVNPITGTQGYDSRTRYFNAAVRATFPLSLTGKNSLVSSISLEGSTCSAGVQGQGNRELDGSCIPVGRTYLKTAAVLTIVDSEVPAGTFRPPYIGTAKPFYNLSQIQWNKLPSLPAPAETPANIAYYQRGLERPWISHIPDWASRALHPIENMLNYHAGVFNFYGNISTLTLLNIPQREDLVIKSIQHGLDMHAMVLNGYGGSGTSKWPILFAGLMLNDSSISNIFVNNQSKTPFREDWMTYYASARSSTLQSSIVPAGKGWTGTTALWRQDPGNQEHEHMHPSEWGPIPPSGGGCKHESYRTINSPHWTGLATSIHLLGGKALWDHPAFFDYVARWMTEDIAAYLPALKQYCNSTRTVASYSSSPFLSKMWNTYVGGITPPPPAQPVVTPIPSIPASPTTPTEPTAPIVPSSGLVAHYTFDIADISGTAITDTSGVGTSGTIVGTVTSVPGKKGEALDLSGTNNYVKTTQLNKVLQPATDPIFSISLWVKPNNISGSYALWGFNSYPYIRYSSGGILRFCQNSATCSNTAAVGVAEQWQHVVVTHDNSMYRVYVNGALALQTASVGDIGTLSPTYTYLIGASSASNFHFPGSIDEVKIYDKVLTQSEVSELYNVN